MGGEEIILTGWETIADYFTITRSVATIAE